jgi:cephalosporin-C deacetylase
VLAGLRLAAQVTAPLHVRRVLGNAELPATITGLRLAGSRPPDFDGFWQATLDELDQQDPEVEAVEVDRSASCSLAEVGFRSLGGARIEGYLLRWNDGAPRPLLLHGHGYGDRYDVRWDWAEAGFHVAGVDVRGFGRSRSALPEPSPYGWILTGLSAPETSVLRGAVCDVVRLGEVASALLGDAVTGVVRQGTSLAGGLAVMAEAQRPSAQLLALAVPTFGWMEGRRMLAHAGSGAEVTGFLQLHPAVEEDAMVVLRYFDTVNHAARVRAPSLVGVGRVDDVVPAPTVYAIVNALTAPCEVWHLPVSHSMLPAEQLWRRFESRWLQRGLSLARAGSATAYDAG